MLDASCAEEEEMVDVSRVGRSRISDNRSTFLAMIKACFRRSKTSFSALLLYLVENARTCSSSSGIASFRSRAARSNPGRMVLRLERWSADATIAP